jgi:hypothetical protein
VGKKKSKSKTKSTPWQPLQQPIIDAVNTASGIVSGNQGNLNSLAGGMRDQLPQLQQMAFGPNPALQAGMGYAQDVLGGKYLDEGNPHLQGMLDQTRESVGNQVNSTFSMAGRTGGGNHVERLGQGLASAENTLRYGDYANERNAMGQMAGMLPALSQAQYAGVMPWLAANETAGRLPYAGVGALSPIIGLAQGTGTTTGTQSQAWGPAMMAAAAQAAAAASDRRLKTNIVELGDWDEKGDGLKRVRWNWKADPNGEPVEGVIADEVARLRPWAYVPNFRGDGYDGVNYAKLGEVG